MNQTIYIPYGTKKYPLIITKAEHPDLINEPWAIRVKCKIANLDQYYDMEDLWDLIAMLPEIIEEQKSLKRQDFLKIRITWQEKMRVEQLASQNGYKNISAYVRDKALQS